MAHAIDLTELNSALGAYCRENKLGIFEQLLFNEDFQQRYQVLDAITDETPLVTTSVKSIIKPADPENFNPTDNAIKFLPRLLKVRGFKADVKIVPQLLYNSWLSMGKMAGRADAVRLELEEFIINHFLGIAKQDVFLTSLYHGVYNPASATPADCMDGFLKLIATEVTANKVSVANNNMIATGAITPANVIDKLEAIYDKIDIKYKQVSNLEMKVSEQIFTWYRRAYRAEFGHNNDYAGMGSELKRTLRLDGANCDVVLEPALGSSQRIICTPKDNMVIGTDLMSDVNQIKTQEFDRTIKFFLDFAMGVQFVRIDDGGFVVNDQA
jgi:hypothetical protein